MNNTINNNFTILEGENNKGVCTPLGFKANGIYCGIKATPVGDSNSTPFTSGKDLALVTCDVSANAAAVFTQNKVKAAPIYVSKNNLKTSNGKAKAVIVNSKNANACTPDGEINAKKMCNIAAFALGVLDSEILVASTGVIGQPLPVEKIEGGIGELVNGLSYDGNLSAATAIMTTDTFSKEVSLEFLLDGKTCKIGGMAKGSGMAHPNMATVLGFITTDVCISSELLNAALSENVKTTFNCFSVDGDTSTNDSVFIMSSGLAGNSEITTPNDNYNIFKEALFIVMQSLTKMLAKDGEGATKLVECVCESAPDIETAVAVAKSVISSSLLKSAIFGEDANWGRILCAVGYSPCDFDVTNIDITISSENGNILVCEKSGGVNFCEETASKILSCDEIVITVCLNQGESSGAAYGCDLTYDYVKINGDYRS